MKLAIKSYYRGYVADVKYLDKWRGAASSRSRDWEAVSLLTEEVTYLKSRCIMAITVKLTPEIEARLISKAKAQGMTAEAFLQATIENLLSSEPQIHNVGTALVVESQPIGSLETFVEQARENRISDFIRDYESPI